MAAGALCLLAAAFAAGCGGGNANSSLSVGGQNGTGRVNVSITDPPSCAFPAGNFDHVFVSVRSVQAHTSSSADDNSPGWQELAPQLNNQPVQLDLLGAGPNACLLATLGSNASVPAGTYQQFRLLLVPNAGSNGPFPARNNCGQNGFNCVVLHDGTTQPLDLSSQTNTGLKIPGGQIIGGAVTVATGQDVNLNIDFNACASVVQQGNGRYRLKPVLTAGQINANNTGISGQIVSSPNRTPIVGGTVRVALEQQDTSGVDVIFEETVADASGNFNFCPLPSGAVFDVVAVAINGAGVAYNATVAVGVPGGTSLGAIPLIAETGTAQGPVTFRGTVSATTGTVNAGVDVSVFATQNITLSGGVTRAVTIPAESTTSGNSTTQSGGNLSLENTSGCNGSSPLHANCAQYTLIEPASNPSVGVFSAGTISFQAPPAGDVLFTIRANAFMPLSGGTVACSPSTRTVNQDTGTGALRATAGTTVTPRGIDFTGCS
jgi:hypothetical protein